MLVAAALAAACGRPDAAGFDLRWTLRPERPTIGWARLTLTLDVPPAASDRATVQVVGHMTHPGMQPVVARVTPRDPGVFDAELTFTMAGDWVLVATVQLADGRRVERRIPVAVSPPPPRTRRLP